jgi:hypothetical protein
MVGSTLDIIVFQPLVPVGARVLFGAPYVLDRN